MGAERAPGNHERAKWLGDAHPEPTVEELRREQRREARHSTLGHTQGQVHGALIGGLVAGLVGVVIGVLIGLLAFDSGSPARIVVPVVVAVFAGWCGLVYGGGRTPEIENETMSAYGEPNDGSDDAARSDQARRAT